MSVILTAGRKRQKEEKKPKKKKHSGMPKLLAFHPLPEQLSTSGTKVWRWVQDGTPYTLAFSRDTLKVWCNGEGLQTEHDFEDEGAIVDFAFNNMKCRIRSVIEDGRISHLLTVDGNNIPDEEAMQALMMAENGYSESEMGHPDV